MTKTAVFFFMPGGQDGLNLVTPTDAPSITAINNFRGGANAAPNFTTPVTTVGSGTSGSNVITVASNSGITTGMKVYCTSIPAVRDLTVSTISGTNITISGISYLTFSNEEIVFKTDTQLYRLKDTTTGRSLAANFTQKFLTDTFNIEDISENSSKIKTAIVTSLGPLRKKVYKDVGNSTLRLVSTGEFINESTDLVPLLASHNSQQNIWQTCTVSATIGAGGRIADFLALSTPASKNKNVLSVSVFNPELYAIGETIDPFTVSTAALVRNTPGYDGIFLHGEDQGLTDSINANIRAAMQVVPPNDDFISSAINANTTLLDYQSILVNAMELTDPPAAPVFNFENSIPIRPFAYLQYLKPLLRMIHANNPNRGFNITRSGNLATFQTEITTGLANRTEGSNILTVTSANHRLFTSTASDKNKTDSVIVLTSGAQIDTNISDDGYKITLVDSDRDNKFTFTTTNNTALVNVPVTIRLKHNYSLENEVYVKNTAFDSVFPVDGHPITAILNSTSFTVTTTASGAYTPTTIFSKVKLIDVPSQLQVISTPAMEWDSHNQSNHSQIAAFEFGMRYFWEIASRIEDADIISYTGTEFGRTVSTNSRGTDHGWATTVYISGKKVKSRTVIGQVTNYVQPTEDFGLDAGGDIPTIGHYQYHATIAKWLGLSDAQILLAFPDLINWPLNERTLDLINP